MSGARGETWIDEEGQQHALLFTNRALVEAEHALKRTVLDIASAATAGNLGVGDVARLALIGLEYSRRDRRENRRSYSIDEVMDILDEFGFTAVAAAVFSGLAAVLSYKRGDGDPPA